MTIIEDFLCELQANAFVMTQFIIDSWDVMPNSVVICFNNSKYVETKFITPEV